MTSLHSSPLFREADSLTANVGVSSDVLYAHGARASRNKRDHGEVSSDFITSLDRQRIEDSGLCGRSFSGRHSLS